MYITFTSLRRKQTVAEFVLVSMHSIYLYSTHQSWFSVTAMNHGIYLTNTVSPI